MRRTVLWSVVGALVLLAGGAGALVYQLNSNISSGDLDVLGNRPEGSAADAEGRTPLNILVMGSDYRGDGNSEYGGGKVEAPKSDTAILLHISRDRKTAVGVSIPRDTLVRRPECPHPEDPANRTIPAATKAGRFNEAFAVGGPLCTFATVEKITDIRLDHYMVIDFSGVAGVTEAIGGVEVCIPQFSKTGAMAKYNAGLDIEPGLHKVQGKQAIDFLRLRHAGRDQSDLQRAKRQQKFMAAVAKQSLSTGVLANPARLYQLADAVTKSLTVDEELASARALADLAMQLKDIDPQSISFFTVPVVDSGDGATVELAPQAEEVWAALKEDLPIVDGKVVRPDATPTPTASTAPEEKLTKQPSQIRVVVENGTSTSGKASEVSEELAGFGFDTGTPANAARSYASTTIVYHPDYTESVKTLKAAVVGPVELVEDEEVGSTMKLIIGDDFEGVQDVTVGGSDSGSGSTGSTPDPAPTFANSTSADEEVSCEG